MVQIETRGFAGSCRKEKISLGNDGSRGYPVMHARSRRQEGKTKYGPKNKPLFLFWWMDIAGEINAS